MSTEKDTTKEQRDRFLAFAFAGADLMLEIDRDGRIAYTAGAVKGIAGIPEEQLVGRELSDLLAPQDRGLVASLRTGAKPGMRFGPVLISFNEGVGTLRKGMLSGIAMPDRPGQVYLTISKAALSQVADAQKERTISETALLDKDSFAQAALEMMAASETLGEKLDMTFVDLPDAGSFKAKIGGDKWNGFRDNISTLLRTYAVDGRAAAALSDGRYGVVHSPEVTAEKIRQDVEALSQKSDPENKGMEASTQGVDMQSEALSEQELARAVMYSINEFEKKGNSFNILSLESGFESFLAENAQKIAEFKQIISQSRFDIKFQPIVNLSDGNVAYYEALVRFADGQSPYDAIVFCEEVGLSPDLDLAICGKVINYLVFNTGNRVKVSVNLSGVSIQNENFVRKLRSKLEPHLKSDIPRRLVFEITESSEITDLDKVNTFVKALQSDGFKVSLDDFGAGSASFQYLNKIHVDTVKIDGQYVTNIITNPRDQAMITNLVQMCRDLKVGVVAERVETKEHVAILKKMGVAMGQGYYFAKPLDEPKYVAKPV